MRAITRKSIEQVAAATYKTNKFPGRCLVCGSKVAAGEGMIAGLMGSGAWAVEHRTPCQEAA